MKLESGSAVTDLWDFTVGGLLVRPSLGQVLNGSERVHVEPRSIDVLIALAERAGELYPKRELIEAVWGPAFVSDEVLTHSIWDLRRALGDDAGDPRFIQTIPKRGYRLIAPVELIEPEPRPLRRQWPPVLGFAAAVLIPALLAIVLFVNREKPDRAVVSDARYQLVLATDSTADGASPQLVKAFDDTLRRLAGTRELETRVDTVCPDEATAGTYCLSTNFGAVDGAQWASTELLDASTQIVVWKPMVAQFADAPGAVAAGKELREQVAAYFEMIGMGFYSDPDIRTWFEISRHDPRAIREFLLGVEYSYRHEIGGRNPMDLAASIDADFVAPRVWRVQALSAEGDRERLEGYLADLARLEPSARPFEQAMISWARAVAKGDVAGEIRHLETALKIAPDNRQLQTNLSAAYFRSGDYDRAWWRIEPLARSAWTFRGKYALAGASGILAGKVREADEVLRLALEHDPVDTDVLALLELLALYRSDTEAAASFRRRLALRIEQIRPEPFDLDPAPYLDYLAARAASEDRGAIARELRQFPGWVR